MEKMVTIGEKEDTENTKFNAIGALFTIIVFISISLLAFFLVFFVVDEKKPSYLIIAAISSVDELEERLKGRMLVMEKGGFNNSDNYRQAEDIKTELELVRDKLSEIKMKLKDKPWAN